MTIRNPWLTRTLGRLANIAGLPIEVEPQEPLARALLDHLERGRPVEFVAERAEGFSYPISTEQFFELTGDTRALDQRALREARGRVLDVGAGAGRHALLLEERGLEVCAIDVAEICVEIMKRRGVGDARRADVFHLDAGRFDTVVLLMQSIGIAGTRLGLESLLSRLRASLRPGGQILLDSSEIQLDEEELAAHEPEESSAGDPVRGGEVEVSFRYGCYRGRPFPWLYLSETLLAEIADGQGWECEILERAPSGIEYLARLSPRTLGTPDDVLSS